MRQLCPWLFLTYSPWPRANRFVSCLFLYYLYFFYTFPFINLISLYSQPFVLFQLANAKLAIGWWILFLYFGKVYLIWRWHFNVTFVIYHFEGDFSCHLCTIHSGSGLKVINCYNNFLSIYNGIILSHSIRCFTNVS